jgi:hypothetical protein
LLHVHQVTTTTALPPPVGPHSQACARCGERTRGGRRVRSGSRHTLVAVWCCATSSLRPLVRCPSPAGGSTEPQEDIQTERSPSLGTFWRSFGHFSWQSWGSLPPCGSWSVFSNTYALFWQSWGCRPLSCTFFLVVHVFPATLGHPSELITGLSRIV